MHHTPPHLLDLLAFAAVVVAAPLSAQQPQQLRPGQRVRVSVDSLPQRQLRLVGTVASLSPGYLVLMGADSGPLTIPVRIVRKLEVSSGTTGSKAAEGALLGFLGGASVGALIGVLGIPRCGFRRATCEFATPVGAAIGGLVGMFVGGVIGAQVSRERWESVPLDRLRVTVLSRPGSRLGLGFSLGF